MLHTGHEYGRSPVCTKRCFFRLALCVNPFLHVEHLNGFNSGNNKNKRTFLGCIIKFLFSSSLFTCMGALMFNNIALLCKSFMANRTRKWFGSGMDNIMPLQIGQLIKCPLTCFTFVFSIARMDFHVFRKAPLWWEILFTLSAYIFHFAHCMPNNTMSDHFIVGGKELCCT